MDSINLLLSLVTEIGYEIENIEPTEFAEQLRTALYEQRVRASHMQADSIDN